MQWLGQIPERWKVRGLGTVLRSATERNEPELPLFPVVRDRDMIVRDVFPRFLVCADKFQTGYGELLLHIKYVGKTLAGIKAVQILSRLNRAHEKKHEVFVFDFVNDTETITEAFWWYYRTTILADEPDPNKLHDLQGDLDDAQVYSAVQVKGSVKRYLNREPRDRPDPILDECVAVYMKELGEDDQAALKRRANVAYDRDTVHVRSPVKRRTDRLP